MKASLWGSFVLDGCRGPLGTDELLAMVLSRLLLGFVLVRVRNDTNLLLFSFFPIELPPPPPPPPGEEASFSSNCAFPPPPPPFEEPFPPAPEEVFPSPPPPPPPMFDEGPVNKVPAPQVSEVKGSTVSRDSL